MKTHYFINKKEQQNMGFIVADRYNILSSIFSHMPEKVISHSRRVEYISGVLAKYVPYDLLPKGMNLQSYQAAIAKGAYYHEIGIYLAGNKVEFRPVAAERVLNEYWTMDKTWIMSKVVFETITSCCEQYDGNGYPEGLTAMTIPLHANLCSIANTVDMIMGSDKSSSRKARKAADYIYKNNRVLFRPDAVDCFKAAQEEIFVLYKNNLCGK